MNKLFVFNVSPQGASDPQKRATWITSSNFNYYIHLATTIQFKFNVSQSMCTISTFFHSIFHKLNFCGAVCIYFIVISASTACAISKTFCIKNTDLCFKIILLFLVCFLHILKILLINLNDFQVILNSTCINSIIIIHCVMYQQIKSSKHKFN